MLLSSSFFGDDELRAYLIYPTQWVFAVLAKWIGECFSTPGPAQSTTSRLLHLPALAVSGGSRSSTASQIGEDVVSADCERRVIVDSYILSLLFLGIVSYFADTFWKLYKEIHRYLLHFRY